MSLEFLLMILLVMILGGALATLGDRIGTKVGKARLSLFNLRPKKTAVLVTIFTGTLISASTMGLLLLVSQGLRDRLLNFDKIRLNLRRDAESAQKELEKANQSKTEVENLLRQAKLERERVQTQLKRINTSLKGAVERQRVTEALRQRVEQQRNQIQGQLIRVSDQALTLRSDIGRLNNERQGLFEQRNQIAQQIRQRDRDIGDRNRLLQQRDREINERNTELAERETRLRELEQQQSFLQNELVALVQIAQDSELKLRGGIPALVRDQPLALALVQAEGPGQARQVIDAILARANQVALDRIQPEGVPPGVPIVQIEQSEIDRLIERISDGSPYVMRVLSSVNYLRGETFSDRRGVRVFIQVAPKRLIFKANAVINAKTLDPSQMNAAELEEWVTQQLIGQANFLARQQGIWATTSNVRLQAVEEVVKQLTQLNGPVEVRAIAPEDVSIEGPLKLEFVILQAGQVILETRNSTT
jgi:uncharacterized protein (DUF3084 family)